MMRIDDVLRELSATLAERVLLCFHDGEGPMNSNTIAGQLRVDVDDVLRARVWLIHLGLAHEPLNLAGHFNLTPRGQRAALIFAHRKEANSMQVQDCAKAILLWLDDASSGHFPVTDTLLMTDYARVGDQQFTKDQVHRAAGWLDGLGLVKGLGTAETDYPVRLGLSDRGRDCVIRFHGDVDAYLGQGTIKAGDSYHVNVADSSNLQIMQGSAGGAQSWTQQLGKVERETVSDLAAQILQLVSELDLPPARIQEISDAAGQIRDSRDDAAATPGKIRALVGTVTTAALGAIGTQAGSGVMNLAGQIVNALPG